MRKPPMKKAVVLLSGGMDSAVVAAMAASGGFRVHALTFRYGQRHEIEVAAAREIADGLNLGSHVIFDLDLALFGGSSLTTNEQIPKDRGDDAESIPSTYVPARNTVFLSLALAHAEALGARDIFIGASSVDYSGYPDCRPEFMSAFEELANLGTRAADGGERFRIHAPLMELSKAETVAAGKVLGVDFSRTRSCYDPGESGAPCGECDSCRLRKRGFDGAGIEDPLRGTK